MKSIFEEPLAAFNAYLDTELKALITEAKDSSSEDLLKSIEYSLQTGGKRFRPLLVLATGLALEKPLHKFLPWSLAIEFVHTYSLIHDDLPCMDNDDFRRGKPTTHKAFGEWQALLAGDALLTEAFQVVAAKYGPENSDLAVKLMGVLAKSSGILGMVGGQSLDLGSTSSTSLSTGGSLAESHLSRIHRLKTGALIVGAVQGASWIGGATSEQMQNLLDFAQNLGEAFQVADDLEDYRLGKREVSSAANFGGAEACSQKLTELSKSAQQILRQFGSPSCALRALYEWNLTRA